ncbi:hypothetical protein L1987_06464 [Smallanthus sonchifolius]|uniref:Uncharacterized protein n=1 Tax=Smallanthus sonchifolius TaxID=185202 RepID=A0ACB9JYK7_9ASTR|nr:hypothetical protein L1987_06464 [Smallanthus sonchifolius]
MDEQSSKTNAFTMTLKNSVQALLRGIDITSDIRMLYYKEDEGVTIPDVSIDIDFSRRERNTEATPIFSFHESVASDLFRGSVLEKATKNSLSSLGNLDFVRCSQVCTRITFYISGGE